MYSTIKRKENGKTVPDLYEGKSEYTVKAASTGPLVIISVWIFSTPVTE